MEKAAKLSFHYHGYNNHHVMEPQLFFAETSTFRGLLKIYLLSLKFSLHKAGKKRYFINIYSCEACLHISNKSTGICYMESIPGTRTNYLFPNYDHLHVQL